ncbi:hypothetical protein [Salipiger marinus]|uniref:hypothetical protein n=1 Tax=Salipiger marinus TaxID=555512 RepID=UPI0040592DBB
MKILPLCGLLLCAGPAFADSFTVYEDALPAGVTGPVKLFSVMDVNRSNVLEPTEIRAAFGPAAREAIMSFDANGDGRLTRTELRAYTDLGTGGPAGALIERVRG